MRIWELLSISEGQMLFGVIVSVIKLNSSAYDSSIDNNKYLIPFLRIKYIISVLSIDLWSNIIIYGNSKGKRL